MKTGVKHSFASAVIIFVLISSIVASLSSNKGALSPSAGKILVNCADIDLNNNKTCYTCFKSQNNLTNGLCGPKLPEADPCLFYETDRNRTKSTCTWCKEGYALASTNKCVPIQKKIEGCAYYILEDSDSVLKCILCHNGYPDWRTREKCLPDGSFGKRIKDCIIGGTHNLNNLCFRCKSGLSLDARTNRRCLKQAVEGCLAYDTYENYCRECDVFNGYFAVTGNSCAKLQ